MNVNVNVSGSFIEVSEEGIVTWFYNLSSGDDSKFIKC
jgi:hypothetical protein